MSIPVSTQFPDSTPPEPPAGTPRWYTAPGLWLAISILAFLAMAVLPMTLAPKPQWAELYEPRLPCEVVDWRVGEKLAVLAERDDVRTRAIFNRMSQQRDIARQHCRAGHLEDALTIYRLVDRALTRYVQAGAAPNLPK
jgi:hypothetical protein